MDRVPVTLLVELVRTQRGLTAQEAHRWLEGP